MFKCAITIGGVTDVRPYDQSPLTAPSPDVLAHRFDVPVMIMHGRNDEYPFQQSRAFHRTLGNAGAAAELVLSDDADHAISRPAHREEFHARRRLSRVQPP